jgi:hypothetical protein
MAYSSTNKGSTAACPTDSNSPGTTAAPGGGKLLPVMQEACSGGSPGALFWSPVSSDGSPGTSAGSKWQGVDAADGEDEESSEWFDA